MEILMQTYTHTTIRQQGKLRVIRTIKGTLHARMGMMKDRNGKDSTEAGDINKRRQEYTEGLYKKGL